MFAVTLATILAAGSLGSTVALARDKTFQSLAMTALMLMIWIGAWEAAAVLAGNATIGGVLLESIAAAASPMRAILIAAHPNRDTLGAVCGGGHVVCRRGAGHRGAAQWRGDCAAAGLESGRELLRAERTRKPRQATKPAQGFPAEAARAATSMPACERLMRRAAQVWDNPVLWREMCTWAYGRKVLVIKAVYWLLFVMAALAIYWTIQSGAAYLRASETIIPAAAQAAGSVFSGEPGDRQRAGGDVDHQRARRRLARFAAGHRSDAEGVFVRQNARRGLRHVGNARCAAGFVPGVVYRRRTDDRKSALSAHRPGA